MKALTFTRIIIILLFSGAASACDKTDNIDINNTKAPNPVTNLEAIADNASVTLSWTNPSDKDFDFVRIQYEDQKIDTYKKTVTIHNLTNEVSYVFHVFAFDKNGNQSASKSIVAKPEKVTNTVYPTNIIPSLVQWKVTLPVDKDGNDSSNATNVESRIKTPWEIKDDKLIDFHYPPYFEVRDGEVVFRGHCAGATTKGSKYPRCELRQRVGGGDNYWSVQEQQYLLTELRVTHLPVVKPSVCMVQIHGPKDEPLRVQFDKNKGMNIVWNEDNILYFKDKVPYELGQKLRIIVTVDKGNITCVVKNIDTNNEFSYTWKSEDQTGYFKVGCYTQSSIFLSEFKSGWKNEPSDAYGEVRVTKITLKETY